MDYILPLLPTLVREVILAVYSFKELLAQTVTATENYGGGFGAGLGGALGAFLGSLFGPYELSGLGGALGGVIGGAAGGFKQHHSHLFLYLGGLGGGMCAGVGALAADLANRATYNRRGYLNEGVKVAVGACLGGLFGGFFGPITGLTFIYKMWPWGGRNIGEVSTRSVGTLLDDFFAIKYFIFLLVPIQFIELGSYKSDEDVFAKYNATLSKIEEMRRYLELAN